MAPSSFWVSAFLALNYGLAQANPMADAMAVAPVATMTIQPVKILTELPVIIRTHCPRPTKIVICHGKTLTVHRPGLLNTVITLTYEETQTRSRLNCGRRTSKTTTPASSAPAIETTSESPGSSGPITSVPTSSTESVSPGSFTTSPTSENVPEISEPGSIPSDSKTGDRYESASNSASSPPRPESSQLSPSSRINIDTAESQTPLPSATTKNPHGDYSDVPEASVSEASSSVVSLSDGSYTAASATVRSESIGSTDRAASLQTSFPSTYGDVPAASVPEASSSVVSLSDGSNTATSVEARTKAGPQTTGSVDRVGSSQTPFSSGASKTYSDYGEVPGASVSESGSSVVSLSDGSRTATSATVRSESIGSTDRAASSQNPFPSTNGDVPGASVSVASSSVVSVSDGSHTATSVTVRSESIGSRDRAGSSQTSFPSTHGDVPGASVSVASPSVNSLSDGSHTATTVKARKKVGPQTTGSSDRSGRSQTPFSSGTSKTYSDYGDVPGASVSESVSSVVSLSDGTNTATTVEVRTKTWPQTTGSADRSGRSQTPYSSGTSKTYSDYGEVPGASASESGSSVVVLSDGSRTATSANVRSESIGSTDRAASLQTSFPSTHGDVSGASVSESGSSNSVTSSSQKDSVGPSSSVSSVTVQAGSASSLTLQSDRDLPSSSQGATLLTPSALDKVQAGTSSSGANVSASSTFSTLLTQDARPSSSSNDDSIQSNSAPRSSSVVGGSISTTDTIHDSSSQTTRVPASKSSGTAIAVEISQSDQSTSASAQSLSRGIPAATSSNVDGSSSNTLRPRPRDT
ncbi:hypothetical protein E4U19_004786 [Claviceps sp. Clav32 group G5]|nr:hypothetical protein E4U19_004786 [Claviceps sp. Clav32 group G5]